MAKLDPDNWKSAKDVMDERQAAALKRKREEDGELSDSTNFELEKPKADQESQHPKAKKRKVANPESQPESINATEDKPKVTEQERIQRIKEAKAAKKERKKERKAKAKAKLDRQKSKKEAKQQQEKAREPKEDSSKKSKSRKPSISKQRNTASSEDDDDDEAMAEPIVVHGGDAFGKGAPLSEEESSEHASDQEVDEVFSPLQDSGTSSSSSSQPASHDDQSNIMTPPISSESKPSTGPKPSKSQNPDSESNPSANRLTQDSAPRERLQAAISAFRAERKADSGPRSRAELLEQRRRQEERRRAEKKEQKRREKEEAARKQEEEIAKRFSPGGSGSLLGSPRSPVIDSDTNNFSFGRVAFADGSTLDSATSTARGQQKKKGPSDLGTALKAAQAKQQRVSGLDAEKRTTIQEKDMWLNARKRAAGEKVKDDTSLLKKALKRHEGQKKKSEEEWDERKEGIQKSIDMKQKKRTENLAKRKDEKGHKGKKGKVKRPGFEGSFRGRTGGAKKKA
jgi:Surfeit locus protein 6